MKILKITLLLIALLFLTVSGQSSDYLVDQEKPQVETYKSIDLIAHTKKGVKIPTQG